MSKRKIRKSEKWNKGRKFSKLRDYKFENEKDESRLDKYSYEKYQRNEKKNFDNVGYKHLEEVFTNEISSAISNSFSITAIFKLYLDNS